MKSYECLRRLSETQTKEPYNGFKLSALHTIRRYPLRRLEATSTFNKQPKTAGRPNGVASLPSSDHHLHRSSRSGQVLSSAGNRTFYRTSAQGSLAGARLENEGEERPLSPAAYTNVHALGASKTRSASTQRSTSTARWMMQVIQNFRDSGRISRAPPARPAAQPRTAPTNTGPKTGNDVVFALVLQLYTTQRDRREFLLEKQLREQREKQRSSARLSAVPLRRPSAVVVGCVTVDDASVDFSDKESTGHASNDDVGDEDAQDGAGVDRWELETAATVRKLRDARNLHPAEVEFYLPQLCIVVALGDFARPVPLVDFVLELCESDLRLAHKTHWFLKAFCAGSGDPWKPELPGLSAFARRVQHRGCMVASRLSRALARREKLEQQQLLRGEVQDPGQAPLISTSPAAPAPCCDDDRRFGPTDRPSATTMSNSSNNINADATRTLSQQQHQRNSSGLVSNESDDVVIDDDQQRSSRHHHQEQCLQPSSASPSSTLPSSVGVAVVTTASNEPSAFDDRHGTVLTPLSARVGSPAQTVVEAVGERRCGGAPRIVAEATAAVEGEVANDESIVKRVWQDDDDDDTLSDDLDGGAVGKGRRVVREEREEEEEDESLAEHYDPAMFFVEALLGLAEQLGDIPSKKRAKGLQEGLERINEFFLSDRAQGSDLIYVPFGESFHQVQAIHPRESMHFSTKERVPLLVCLEVQELNVPRAFLARSASRSCASMASSPAADRAARSQASSPVYAFAVEGQLAEGAGARGDVEKENGEAAETGATVSPAPCDDGGEAGMLDRYLGTVRSYVKLPSGAESPDSEEKKRVDTMALKDPVGATDGARRKAGQDSSLIDLGDYIPADECASGTDSEIELSAERKADLALTEGQGGLSTGYDPIDGTAELRDDGGGGSGGILGDGDGDGDDYGGASSQGGFWYGEGDGASALEAAMGQWGGDLINLDGGSGLEGDIVIRRDTETDDDSSAHGMIPPREFTENIIGDDNGGTRSAGVHEGGSSSARHRVSRDFDAAAVGEGGSGAGAEDESWEIVDAPGHWEEGYKATTAGACGDAPEGITSKSDSQSDSYSEYLAAAEAERLDRQLAAEAEEEEAREAEALARGSSGVGVAARDGGGGGRCGTASPGRVGNSAASGARGDSTKGPKDGGRRRRSRGSGGGGDGAGGGGGGGKTLDDGQQQPRIIFKEQWREKEARVWHERAAASVWQEGGHRAGFGARALAAVISADVDDGAAGAPIGARMMGRSGGLPIAPGWKLLPIIVKANDDLRQEQFVSQLVGVFDQIFSAANLGARLRPYEIMATSPTAGLIEAIPDTVSLDALKRHVPHLSLHEFFRRHFGRRGMMREARSNFVESCAAYSVVCYLLQIKDRHNGNLLLSAHGHLIHIDWGFALDLSPGGNLGFESAPFKLTQEFVEVMGGARSTSFQRYRSLCVRTFLEARRSRDKIITLVEMMVAFRPNLACFGGRPDAVLKHLRSRFKPDLSAEKCVAFVGELIEQSMDNWRTRWFDIYQKAFVGIQ